MQPITAEMLVVLDHSDDAGEGNEENIEEVKESFTSMRGNLSI